MLMCGLQPRAAYINILTLFRAAYNQGGLQVRPANNRINTVMKLLLHLLPHGVFARLPCS